MNPETPFGKVEMKEPLTPQDLKKCMSQPSQVQSSTKACPKCRQASEVISLKNHELRKRNVDIHVLNDQKLTLQNDFRKKLAQHQEILSELEQQKHMLESCRNIQSEKIKALKRDSDHKDQLIFNLK